MARSDWKRPALTPLADGMKRIRLTIAYDGSLFNGWQCQTNGVGVQDVFGHSGSAWEVLRQFGLSSDNIAATARALLRES